MCNAYTCGHYRTNAVLKKERKNEIFAISYPYLLHMPWNGNHKKIWWTIYHIREQGISEVCRLRPEHPNNEKAEAKTQTSYIKMLRNRW